MRGPFSSRTDLAKAIVWKGDIFETLDAGIDHTDMPPGEERLAEAWKALERAWVFCHDAAVRVRELLPELAVLEDNPPPPFE